MEFDRDETPENIFRALEQLPVEFPVVRGFIDGEFDSSQTSYETLSNNLTMGTVARSIKEGRILLFFLRMYWDGHFDLLETYYHESEAKTLEELMDYLADTASTYSKDYDISNRNNEISVELYYPEGSRKITRQAYQIQWWSRERLEELFEWLMPNRRQYARFNMAEGIPKWLQ